MTQPRITREGSRYVARVDGVDAEAELVFRRVSDKRIAAVHTEVPDVFRGQGIGRLLVTRMVEDARAEGVKIRAVCTYVNAERKKHPDWADVFEN
jgi:predicted GNAT family acetyltransferase